MVDRQANFDEREQCADGSEVFAADVIDQDDQSSASPTAYAIFQRCMHDACMNIELAIESDALGGHEWQRLNRQLNYIANIAALFSKEELGPLSRELAQGLEILSPRARVRRLRNARSEFTRLAVREDRVWDENLTT